MTLQEAVHTFKREHATTRKVLQALPADQALFKPHERSNTALMLGWTCVAEERLIAKALSGQPVLGGGWPTPPATWQEVLDAFEASYEQVLDAAARAVDGSLAPVTFYVAPKQTGEYAALDFVMFMLFDQIHHRGQFSVYLRLAGGKVPSIYGPSADEPWT